MSPVIIIIVLVLCLISSSVGGYLVTSSSPAPSPSPETETKTEPEAEPEAEAEKVRGCTDNTATNYSPSAEEDDGSCTFAGCINESATNYNPIATEDDGSCKYRELSLGLLGKCSGHQIDGLQIYPADISGGWVSSVRSKNEKVINNVGANKWASRADDFNTGADGNTWKMYVHTDSAVMCDDIKTGPVVITKQVIGNGQMAGTWKNPDITLPPYKADSNEFVLFKR